MPPLPTGEAEILPALEDGARPVLLDLGSGPGERRIACRYHPAPEARTAVLMVGGVGGGWDSPAASLYPHLCQTLPREGTAALRVRFRHPGHLEESVVDVLAGLTFLQEEGATRLGLVGHSFGGAVALQAAALEEEARAVVTLATQSYGAGPVGTLAPRCAALFVHGTADTVLPYRCSVDLHDRAGEPRRLVLHEGAGHGLDEAAEAVRTEVEAWFRRHLQAPV
ncbi:MAG TPA: alpha/beta fold hydrolase [Candidatus Thermoplasmatota archaeon]|nr:alpha/beta fold hydrolase [Candidatus Thermoplasmatota archaeon]